MPMKTHEPWYAKRLATRELRWWKRFIDVQWPYRRHLRKMRLGFVLDVGCGVGRGLLHLGGADAGVGVDHNLEAVQIARKRGVVAYTVDEFFASPDAKPSRFDALLFSHVAEHMRESEAGELIRSYLPFIRTAGRIVVMTPQEAGFRSDPTHVEFMDFAAIGRFLESAGCRPADMYSFPFPRAVGKIFKYNEFVVLATRS